jgi:uncharacterized protein (DUF1330 family)
MISIHDPETYKKFTDHPPPVVKKSGGKFLTRGELVICLEGEDYSGRLIILGFTNKEKAEAWFTSCPIVSCYFQSGSFSDATPTCSGRWRKCSGS